ncbi:MAG TPA: PQQ-binding-like beta-propeller repeat protein [Vicinamibacterales bacterium]|nr:PQQ-binding-like beta-propeller repeat protein [Vicinamibacterales bacterium]
MISTIALRAHEGHEGNEGPEDTHGSRRQICLAMVALLLCIGVRSASAQARAGQPPSGEAVYKTHCAACHDSTSPRIPGRDALKQMPAGRILRALDGGAMLTIAFTMSRDERLAVSSYLGTSGALSGSPASAFCSDRTVRLDPRPRVSWNGWSPGTSNARFQTADAAGIRSDQVAGLKLKWAFGFDGDVSAFAQPTVIDGHVFAGSAAGVVHAMRADRGCLEWTFQANGPVRAAILAVPSGGGHVLLFGDMTGWFYALRADTGALLWKVHIETHDSTRLTAAATANEGVVYVPVSSWEESRASDANYPCCTFRGSVVALRISDGQQLWKTYFVDPPKPLGKTANGVAAFGPSGAGVWSTPTVDARRRRLYVATSNNYSVPASTTSAAVVALDLASGRIEWSKQFSANDIFSGACPSKSPSCPDGPGPDFDFAASTILTARPGGGGDVLLAGSKSGVVFALDPDKNGNVLWQTRVGKGGTSGGIQWGMAADGQRVYAAVSDMNRTFQSRPLDPQRFVVERGAGGGITALDIADGSKAWSVTPPPCASDAPAGCNPAQSAAVTAIPGVVFSPSNDGHVRAYATTDGKVLWDFNTMREFDTVNGVKARGGSIDGPGVVVAGGMVFVTSGYSRNGAVPGNVLLAFEP